MARRLPVYERTCHFCENKVEDEYHVIFDCKFYANERKGLINKAIERDTNFMNLDANEKLKVVFGAQDNEFVKLLAKTLWTCLEKRKEFFTVR